MVLCTVMAAAAQNAGNHTLTICANGQLNAFGRNASGQLGLGPSFAAAKYETPQSVSGMTDVVCTAVGESHSLVALEDGTVWAWGSNGSGSIGQPYPSVLMVDTPVQVILPGCAVAVSAGLSFSLALLADGTIWSWGTDLVGQLGNDLPVSYTYGTPQQVSGITNAIAISAGSQHGMALLATGTVKTWGAGTSGELGNSAWINKYTPVAVTSVAGFSDIIKIDAGGSHCIALTGSNQVFTWGSDFHGQIGDGLPYTDKFEPQLISLLSASGTVTDVAAGANFSIVIRSDGSTRACGSNVAQELTKCSPTTDQHTPVAGYAFPSTGELSVASTTSHGVYINGAGQLYTWGKNFYGNTGNGTSSGSVCNPVLINGGGSGICSMIPSEDNHPQPCCVAVREDSRIQLGASGNQTYSGGFNYIGQNLSINNTITLQSGAYYFTSSDVVCWKDAKIVVKSSASLYIRTNSHLYACGDMWDGIYVEDGGTVYVYSGSIIEDAEVAIDVDKNGRYYLVDATLNKNYIHLRHTGPATVSPFRVLRSKFLCQVSATNAIHTNLLPPRQNEFTATQIIATNVNKLYVGSSGNGNKFDYATFGVMVNGVTDVEVLYSDFDDVSAGTYVTNTPNVSGAQIDINYNTYDKSIYPIFCYDNDVEVRAHITDNTINFNGMVSPPQVMTGITYQEITAASGYDPVNPSNSQYNYVDITNNNIYNAPCGIQLVNLTGDQTAPTAKLYIGENYITHTKIPNDGQAGIKTANVRKGVFKANEVKHPSGSVNWWETGIRISDGYGNALTCNNTHQVGRGIFLDGSQTPDTRLIQNTMEANQIGLFLNWSVIGPQGVSGDPRDNQWLGTSWSGSNPNTHVEGTSGLLSPFYVRPSSPYNPQFNNDGNGGIALTISTTSGTWGGGCIYTSGASFKTDGALGEDTEDLLSLIAAEEPQTERERSLQFMGHYNIYDMLFADAELASTNSELETFVADRNADNMGKLHQVVANFGSARGENAETEDADILYAIQPQNLVEQTLKDVFGILYANATDLGQLNADSEVRLREIAQLCPLDYGFGVYTARAALIKLDTLPKNYLSECERVSSPEQMSKKRELEDSNVLFSLYPNPNNGTFNLNYVLNEGETGTVEVFSAIGQQIYSAVLQSGSESQGIGLSGTSNGIYQVRVTVNGDVRLSSKLVILN
jgi:alpha-tubulin suppressor-like RCC1 family protein